MDFEDTLLEGYAWAPSSKISKVYKWSKHRWTALLISLKEFPFCKWYCQWFQTVHCLGLRVSHDSRRGWTQRLYRQALRKHGSFAAGLDLWFLRVSWMKAEFASLILLPLPTPILLLSPPPPPLEHTIPPFIIIPVIYIYATLSPICVSYMYMFRADHSGLKKTSSPSLGSHWLFSKGQGFVEFPAILLACSPVWVLQIICRWPYDWESMGASQQPCPVQKKLSRGVTCFKHLCSRCL